MSYKDKASKISQKYADVTTSLSCVKTISFDDNWKGKAKESLIPALKKAIEELEKVGNSIETFVSALQELDKYKTKKESIVSLKKQYNSISSTKENVKKKNSLATQINNLISDNRTLRKSIESKLSTITPVTTIVESMPMSNFIYETGNGNFVVDVKVLLAKFQNGSLKKLADGDSLYNYFTEEEVNQLMNSIKSEYQGRYLAVNSALGIVDMAASKNLKLDYDWGGGHSTITSIGHVATGTDCSAFVSWAINQGAPGDFTTRTTAGLINVGKTINYEEAREGDILVYNNGENGHVVMVVENNPDNKTFVVVEANGQKQGVILKTRKYSDLRSSNYKAKDLSELYNESENQIV